MGAFRTAIGCGCCGCITFEDAFTRGDSSDLGADWSELAGDWSISSNALTVSSTEAAVQCQQQHSSADMAVVVDVTCPTSGDKARVCVRMVDEDNYLCAELTFGAGTGALKLFSRESGVDTERASATSLELEEGTTFTLTLCVLDSLLTAQVANSGGLRLSGVDFDGVSGTDKHAGLATGDTLDSSATFGDFMLMRREASCQTCSGGICAELPLVDAFASLDQNWEASDVQAAGGVLESTGASPIAKQCIQDDEAATWTIRGELTFVAVEGSTGYSVFELFTEDTARVHIVADDGGYGAGTTYIIGAGTNEEDSGVAVADGDVVAIEVEKIGAGDYEYRFYVNDVLVGTLDSPGLGGTLDLFDVGIAGDPGVGTLQWDNLTVEKTA